MRDIVLLVYWYRQLLSFIFGILNVIVKLIHINIGYKAIIFIGILLMLPDVILAQSRPPVTVFAAISSRPVLEPLLDKFMKEKNIQVQVSYASSAVLAKQIQQGAKADIFISADEDWIHYLEDKQLILKEHTAFFLGNKLAFVSHPADNIIPFTDINLLQELLISNDKIAVGDPQIVPLGRYTAQMLKNLQLLELVQSHLVKALDAQATAKLIERKETRFGFVYLTDALANPLLKILFVLPPYTHDPIIYPIALIGHQPNAEAMTLYQFLQDKRHRALIEQQGFSIP